MDDLTPLSAVTSADPYPYYARLVEERPFYRDDALGMWVASSAAAVEGVLGNAALRVRPSAEPVPAHLVGSAVGDTFGALVRMNDGARHSALRSAVAPAIAETAHAFADTARQCAGPLVDRERDYNAFAHALPVLVVARLLGVPTDHSAVDNTRAFARALAAGSTESDVAAGVDAVTSLRQSMRASSAGNSGERAPLLEQLRAEAQSKALDEDDVIANAIGLLFQGYDATAGLIGNTLVALARQPAYTALARVDASFLRMFVAEVARHDAPVHNTRRYAAADTVLRNARIAQGDCVLVVVAAANRDPQANERPDCFDPHRTAPRCYTFGAGAHGCPGTDLAIAIASGGVAALLDRGVDLARLAVRGYRPSANIRIAVLGTYERPAAARTGR